MGYGYGRTTYHGNAEARDVATGAKRASVFDNSMVAHVWNSQAQTFGRSHNGNFYFEGPTLFSYGSHFPVATILPDGVALLNADSYGVTTSQHKGDARGACRNRARFSVPALEELLPAVLNYRPEANADSRERAKRVGRAYLEKHAEALADWRENPAGKWEWEESAGRTSLEYLASLFGFGRAAGKIKREAIAKREREAKAKAKRELERRKAEAIRLDDMTDSEWRRFLTVRPDSWNQPHDLKRTATELNRARRDAKALGLSDKRKARLWQREKRLRLVLAEWNQRLAVANKRKTIRDSVAAIRRNLPEVTSGLPAGAHSRVMYDKSESARKLHKGAAVLAESRRLPAVSRSRLAALAATADSLADKWRESYTEEREKEIAEERRLAAASAEEKRLAWLSGESPRLFSHFDCPEGGAALRVYGEELQTSHGASVPLAHAIKAFRFLKLIRERGETWQRNGKTIRVGHFQIDRIEPDGSFKAGCHDIKWPEVARLALALGIFAEEASAEAEERTSAH